MIGVTRWNARTVQTLPKWMGICQLACLLQLMHILMHGACIAYSEQYWDCSYSAQMDEEYAS